MQRIIIDVREPSEFANGHVEGAVNIPLSEIMQNGLPDSITKDHDIILYCNSGNRSGVAERYLKSKGCSSVVNGINQRIVEAKYE